MKAIMLCILLLAGVLYAGAQTVHVAAGFLAGDPAGVACAGGNATVKSRGELQHAEGALLLKPGEIVGNHKAALGLEHTLDDIHASLAQPLGSALGLGIGIMCANNHAGNTGLDDGFRAGTGLALVIAGLKGDHHGAATRGNTSALGILQAGDFRVGAAGMVVVPPGNNDTVVQKHGSHGRIGVGVETTLAGFKNGLSHGEGKAMGTAHDLFLEMRRCPQALCAHTPMRMHDGLLCLGHTVLVQRRSFFARAGRLSVSCESRVRGV